MSRQVVWGVRRSVSRQIGGTCANHAAKRTDPYRHHAAVRQRADAQPDVNLFLKQTLQTVIEDQTHIYIRIGLEEIHQDRHEADAPEVDRGGYYQLAGRRGILAG